jgi:hypothetical protein
MITKSRAHVIKPHPCGFVHRDTPLLSMSSCGPTARVAGRLPAPPAPVQFEPFEATTEGAAVRPRIGALFAPT